MNSLPDAERDASDVVQALASIAALLARPLPGAIDAADSPDPQVEEARRVLLSLAEDGCLAAQRVAAYLRAVRGAGDGEAVAVPPRLGLWRHWVAPRGNLFTGLGDSRRLGELPQRRPSDPGE